MKPYFENLLRRRSIRGVLITLVIVLMSSPLTVILPLAGWRVSQTHHPVEVTARSFWIFVPAWILGCAGVATLILIKLIVPYLPPAPISSKPKPRVVVWKHNNMTMLTTREEYELALAHRERLAYVGGFPQRMMIISPRLYALFNDNSFFSVNSMETYQRLVEGCVVEKLEMFVPGFGSHGDEKELYPRQMWKLIHGVDAPADLVR